MTITFKVYAKTRYVGSTAEETYTVEVDDDATEEEIEKIKNEYAENFMQSEVDWGWYDAE